MAGTTTKTAGPSARGWPRTAALVSLLLSALLAPVAAAAQAAGAPPPAPAAVAPPAAPAVEAGPPPNATVPHDEEFELRVRALEESVGELKEQVFRSKARLLLLGERAAGGDLASGAKAVIVHRNEMGGAFVLESVTYRLDGATVFDRVDAGGDLAKKDEFEVWNGRTMPGQHTVAVTATYRGNGYGLFPYLEGYKFRTTSSYDFTADGGKVTTVKVVGYEKGGFTTELKDRPAVRFDVSVATDVPSRQADSKR